MKEQTILITGGAGFVGSNIARYLKRKLPQAKIICFDNLMRNGSSVIKEFLQKEEIVFVKGDVRDKAQLMALPEIDVLIECSAEPSVLASYQDPSYAIDTNLVGAIHCLELARRDNASFIFLSSSRVYPVEELNALAFEEKETRFDWTKDLNEIGVSFNGIRKEFPLNGRRSLYGATKLSAEHMVQEYMDMFGLRGVINRFGVIAGPWQMGRIDQGIVGFWVARHFFGGDLRYIGFGCQGKQVRDVLHVNDVCDLIWEQMQNLDKVSGQIFNAGGGRANAFSLQELTKLTEQVTGKAVPIGADEQDRQADIRIYITDNAHVSQVTGWIPKRSLEKIAEDIYGWMKEYRDMLENILR